MNLIFITSIFPQQVSVFKGFTQTLDYYRFNSDLKMMFPSISFLRRAHWEKWTKLFAVSLTLVLAYLVFILTAFTYIPLHISFILSVHYMITRASLNLRQLHHMVLFNYISQFNYIQHFNYIITFFSYSASLSSDNIFMDFNRLSISTFSTHFSFAFSKICFY